MTPILLSLLAGILLGLLLLRKPLVLKFSNRLFSLSVYMLLFLLGVSVGRNKEVMSNLGKIGYEALVIAVASIAGSVLLSTLLYHRLFRKPPSHEK
ncbi:MAG: lysine exporter LysO family protein [Marinilabiliales bacterium]|nr:lysine exporter LysO family protein [Marinilabiliales bacterium]